MPRRHRNARGRPRGDAVCAGKDFDCSASQCGTESEFSEGYRDQPNNCSGSAVSHATTPSWRSRSFPPNFKHSGSRDNGEQQQATVTERQRLPPLPSEARGPKRPCSEVRYLGSIASEVNEANGMLADSFIASKRRTDSDASFQSSFACGHGGGARPQAELSAILEGQSQCGSYAPGSHFSVNNDEDAQSRAYSYHVKSEVAESGEVHHHHYHVLHHYH